MNIFVVIENLGGNCTSSIEEIVQKFSATGWIKACTDNLTITVENSSFDSGSPLLIHNNVKVLDFYKELLSVLPRGTQIVRIRNPYFPLNSLLWHEQCEEFPVEKFQYVLLTADECGFGGFFLERFGLEALLQISACKVHTMPPGYFNGMSLQKSGRQWFSLPLRRYYLEEHFESLYDSPRWLAINTIPGCNYRCEKCQYHSPRFGSHKSVGTPMSIEKLGAILDKCKDYKRLASVAPTITGEPLLHPEIIKIVSMIKEAGYTCSFASNASLLTRDLSQRLLGAGVDGLAFSVDSVNPETYRKLQGGDLLSVERNIMAFQEETLRRQGTFSGSVICVVSKENEQEIEKYRSVWLKRGFTVIFSAEHDISANYRPFFSHGKWAPKHRMPCFALWQGLYLTNEGRPVTCGSMAKTQGLKEGIFTADPADLWRCKALTMLRRQQLSGQTPKYCREFSCWTGQMSTWIHENERLVCHTQGSWLEEAEKPQAILSKEPWYAVFRNVFGFRKTDGNQDF